MTERLEVDWVDWSDFLNSGEPEVVASALCSREVGIILGFNPDDDNTLNDFSLAASQLSQERIGDLKMALNGKDNPQK